MRGGGEGEGAPIDSREQERKDGARNWFDYGASCFFGRFSRGQDAARVGNGGWIGGVVSSILASIMAETLPKTRDSICRLQIKTAARRGPQKWAWITTSIESLESHRSRVIIAPRSRTYYTLDFFPIPSFQSVKPERVTSYKSFTW